ncbi:MAG: HIT family protein [Sandaracinaceae bacterium]|nr:HIT family protein [Sandaracinaceae bacterium]
MPELISRAAALSRIEREGGRPACLMCAVRDRAVGDVHAIFEDDAILVMLPRYVRRWGQIMVLPKSHATSFAEVDPALWARVNELAHRAARVVERVRAPRRVYVASTGSGGGELTQSSMHLHVHVIPLYEPDDKPSSIFSWQDGVWVAAPAEWIALRDDYVRAWSAQGE